MKREIIFRGLTLDGKWKYGYYFRQGAFSFIQNEKGGNEAILPESVGQFTGLTDRNGNKIFEGDVIALPYITPMGQITTEEDEDLRTHVVFENGEFALKMQLRNIPLSDWIEREEGEYISNHGNKVIFKGFLGTRLFCMCLQLNKWN